MAGLLVLPTPAVNLYNGTDFNRIASTHWSCRTGKGPAVPQSEPLARTPELHLPKGKRNRAISSNHEIVRWKRVKEGKSQILARKRKVRAEA